MFPVALKFPDRIRTVLIAVLTLLAGCFSQVSAPKEQIDVIPVEKPFLWQAKKGTQNSWLFGTIHMGIDAERELPKKVWDAFAASDCFVMEANPAEVTVSEIAKYAYLPAGQRLSKMVTPEIYERLKKRLNGALPEALIDRAQPWFVSVLLLRSGESGNISMDATMLARAKQTGKKIHFLEDWREALKELAAVTTADDLEEMLIEEGQLDKDLKELVDAYRTGEEEQLAIILERVYGHSKTSREKLRRLIDGRNLKWMPNLTAAMDGSSCFIAVGAGHYLGAGSLKSLLGKSGWRVL